MAPTNLSQRRTHNILLINKILNQRDSASPFTLILDDLEQTAKPLIAEFISRTNGAKVKVVFVSFVTAKKPRGVEGFVRGSVRMVDDWQKKVIDHLKAEPGLRKLLIFDTLNPLCVVEPAKLTTLLQSFITPSTSVLAVYSTDIPHPPSWDPRALYTPLPSQLLRYLATTIITMHSLDHIVGCKAARERSHAEPAFGLGEGVAGVIQSHAANYAYGVVLEMDHRRKSGRDVREWYFLPSPISSAHSNSLSEKIGEVAMLLADHPLCATSPEETPEGVASTFALGLTGKQKSDRDGVVLPYFDAQKGDGEGGRILYDMGSEDDFDEEEDEI